MSYRLTPRQEALLARVVEVLEREPVNTPNPHRISQELSIPIQAVEAIIQMGVVNGTVLKIDEVVYYTPKQLTALLEDIRDWSKGEPFTLSELRDRLNTTRKYMSPLINYFDVIGLTSGPASAKIVTPREE